MRPSSALSAVTSPRTLRRDQPLARITPNSTYRSAALVSIVLAMPTPPTRSERPIVSIRKTSSWAMTFPTWRLNWAMLRTCTSGTASAIRACSPSTSTPCAGSTKKAETLSASKWRSWRAAAISMTTVSSIMIEPVWYSPMIRNGRPSIDRVSPTFLGEPSGLG